MCQDNGTLTPEDEFAVWSGPTGPITIVSIFQLYDHSWHAPGTKTNKESLVHLSEILGVICGLLRLRYPASGFPG